EHVPDRLPPVGQLVRALADPHPTVVHDGVVANLPPQPICVVGRLTHAVGGVSGSGGRSPITSPGSGSAAITGSGVSTAGRRPTSRSALSRRNFRGWLRVRSSAATSSLSAVTVRTGSLS